MGDLTDNFNRSEFACKCGCGFDEIALDTVYICQNLRDHFGNPVTITSGCRCPEHNASVGGAENSQHVAGTAADVVVRDVHPHDVYEYLEAYSSQLSVGGLGKYESFTHVDTRGRRARW